MQRITGSDMSFNKKLQELKIENANLHQRLHDMAESYHREASKMRSDPTYWASGLYAFTTPYKDRYFHVVIMQGNVTLMEKCKDYNLMLEQVPPCCPVEPSSPIN